jgi:hypothetical protein
VESRGNKASHEKRLGWGWDMNLNTGDEKEAKVKVGQNCDETSHFMCRGRERNVLS